jgi:hypothetical protein
MKQPVFYFITHVQEYICTHKHAYVHIYIHFRVDGRMITVRTAKMVQTPLSIHSRRTGSLVTQRTVSGDRRFGQTCHKCLRQISEWSLWPPLVLCRHRSTTPYKL